MIKKHTVRSHKGATFVTHVTRSRLVSKPRRVGRWCKSARLLQLSSLFAHPDASGTGKSLDNTGLLNRSRQQCGFKIRARGAESRHLNREEALNNCRLALGVVL